MAFRKLSKWTFQLSRDPNLSLFSLDPCFSMGGGDDLRPQIFNHPRTLRT